MHPRLLSICQQPTLDPSCTLALILVRHPTNDPTLSATILANCHNIVWQIKTGVYQPSYTGCLFRACTVHLGSNPSAGNAVHVPVSDVLSMMHPNVLVLGDWDLQRQVMPHMAARGKPPPFIYYYNFIAANQEARADATISGMDKLAHLEQLRADIRRSKAEHGLDRAAIFWTANTERHFDTIPSVNDADTLLTSIKASPSTLFAVAAILESEPFRHKVFAGGGDLKSGQTKLKFVFAEFLVNASIKLLSIASYNHLGNIGGHDLTAEPQFKSSPGVVKGTKAAKGERPAHAVVIKYVPAVCNSKRAIDEYYPEIFCGRPLEDQHHQRVRGVAWVPGDTYADASGRPTRHERHARRRGRSRLPHSRSRSRESFMSVDEMILEATAGDGHDRQGVPTGRLHSQSLTHHPSQQMSMPRVRHHSQSPIGRDYLAVLHSRSGGASWLSAHLGSQ
ncbi:uncharacterized protein C8Q71DRAFT_861377 [Rhodofomes roseus]|uniref:inositol-3-phosphate synthase n=1 Tax=Rhodofomes roseus TaxID=34475 RepID=A0ABQ8K573_9APHY|nr:uncharacterized protein C8Q71DRAFT_861377 [Rhodofomes roseus]KAH9832095.1 hypothetical protein C8Q71DRAFT_861377 [Rhodofomes roseus]